MLAFLFLTVDG